MGLEAWLRGQGVAVSDTTLHAVVLDLDVPDDVLQAEFAQWLQMARLYWAAPRVPRHFTTADYARWCDDGYVPYHLLRLWAWRSASRSRTSWSPRRCFRRSGTRASAMCNAQLPQPPGGGCARTR